MKSTHLGRAFAGHAIEDACSCPQAPCGLIDWEAADPGCAQHGLQYGKTMRQGHPASLCSGVTPASTKPEKT